MNIDYSRESAKQRAAALRQMNLDHNKLMSARNKAARAKAREGTTLAQRLHATVEGFVIGTVKVVAWIIAAICLCLAVGAMNPLFLLGLGVLWVVGGMSSDAERRHQETLHAINRRDTASDVDDWY